MRAGYPSAALLVAAAFVLLTVLSCRDTHQSKGAEGEVRAERFVVVGSDGRERAELGGLSDGSARLVLRSPVGKRGAIVTARSDGTVEFGLVRDDGNIVAELALSNNEEPLLLLRDGTGRRRLGAICSKGGAVSLVLCDSTGLPRAELKMAEDGSPYAVMKGQDGKPRIALAADAIVGSGLDFSDDQGTTRLTVSVDTAGRAMVAAFDPNGQPEWIPEELKSSP